MIVTEFQIPAGQPYPEDEVGPLGPSAELVDFFPKLLDPADIVERYVDDVSPFVGTYGMGSPGFFGFRLGDEWLVVALWGAASWMHAAGRLVEDLSYDIDGRPKPWLYEDEDEFYARVVGHRIELIEISRTSMRIGFDSLMFMTIEKDPSSRPILQGSKDLRAFKPDDDLRRAVFLSPTAEIWVG